ncbi:MAG TPA: hypothetical protein VN838_11005 [Bradyrhizobium sp.]|nr:hypothetical protein [Bradyrhizobium sp.]
MRNQLRGATQTELPHDARAMLADGEFRDTERPCDFPAAHALADQRKNFHLSLAEAGHAAFTVSACDFGTNRIDLILTVWDITVKFQPGSKDTSCTLVSLAA